MLAISRELSTFSLLMVIKATLLLAATVLCLRVTRRSTASKRHMISLLGLTGLVLLPVLTIALPSWSLDSVLPGMAFAVSSAAQLRPAADGSFAIAGDRAVLLIWLAGASFVVLRGFLGWGLVKRELRRSVGIEETAWRDDLETIARRNDLAPSRLSARMGRVNSTLTCGVLRPAILVPRGALSWTTFQRRAILAHEAAHIRRHDCLFNYVAQLACALFWFHPLAWRVAASLYREQELACDDAVLSQGMPPAAYASLLLESARALPSRFLFACPFLGSFEANRLRERFAYLLDGTRNHTTHARFAKSSATTFLLALTLLSAIKPGNAEEIYKIGGEVSAPRLLIKSEPEYTDQAKKDGVQGVVVLSVVIGTDGLTRDIAVTKTLEPDLDRNAMKAVRGWRFEAAQRQGKAVTVRANIEVNFRLE